MADGIKDKVAILGMGCTQFGEHWESSAEDLALDAFLECLDDAGIDRKEIQAAFVAFSYTAEGIGGSAIAFAKALKLPYIPVSRVENFCASGTEAFRYASYAVASGACDIALALGCEKLKDSGFGGLSSTGLGNAKDRMIASNISTPGAFAQVATAYSNKYGIPIEKIKEALTHISYKSHANGAMNPRAHLRRPVTKEQIAAAPMIAYPLGLFDCCGVSDGAAAAIVTTPEIAKSLKSNQDIIKVKALQIAATSSSESKYQWDGTGVVTTQNVAQRAYAEAGIKNPRDDLTMMEVHDCFSITEFVTMEDLQVSPKGGAYDDVVNGFFDLDGKIPCQVDGGLKCFGHPIGASGLRMIFAMYEQLTERVPEERKVKNARMGLTHNLGGVPWESVAGMSIIGRD